MEATFGWGWRESVGGNAFFGWYVFSSRVLLLFLLWLMDGGVVQTKPSPLHRSSKISAALPNFTTCYLFTTFKNVVHCRSVVLVCGLRAWSLEIPPRYDFSMTDHCSTCLPCRQVSFETSTLGVLCIFSWLNYWFVFVMIGYDVLKIQHVSFFLSNSQHLYTLNLTQEKTCCVLIVWGCWLLLPQPPKKQP